MTTFASDYPGAIVVEAAWYGYWDGSGQTIYNTPAAWCLHTPEEPADDYPSTPYYFSTTDRRASTTYFVSSLGFVFQCVPENQGAYANARQGVPGRFDWELSGWNLNLQTLSVEIEGFANTIHQTMPRGSPQWKALAQLMAHRCKALGFPPERTFGHVEVSSQRTDPGTLNKAALIEDVQKEMIMGNILARLVVRDGDPYVYADLKQYLGHITDPALITDWSSVVRLPKTDTIWQKPRVTIG